MWQAEQSAKGTIMKKIYRLVATFLSLFLLLSVTSYAYDPANSGISYSPTSDSMIYTNTQNFNQGAIVNAFNTLPENVRNLVRADGIQIFYTSGVTGKYDGYTTDAIISYNDRSKKVISVQRPRVYVYTDANSAIIIPHEFGHVLDCMGGYRTGKYVEGGISGSQEWRDILSRNAGALKNIDAHANTSVGLAANEAFAEAFRLYCTNPNGLKAACPEVYNFISAQIAKYAGGAPAPSSVTKKNFDAKAYADTYPDLKAAFGYDKNALWNHYISYGKAEGRTVTAVQ